MSLALVSYRPLARVCIGPGRESYVLKALMDSLYKDPNASVEDLREAVEVFETIPATASRVLGSAHPDTKTYEKALAKAKKALADKSSA